MKFKKILWAIAWGVVGVCLQPFVMPFFGQILLDWGL